MKKTIIIEGMSCKHCVAAVEKALKNVKGVSKVNVDLDNKSAVVEGESLEDTLLEEAIDDAGYEIIEIR